MTITALIPSDVAIASLYLDQNGLYVNDFFNDKGYTSPYYAVHIPTQNSKYYLSQIGISKEIYDQMIVDSRVSNLISRGFIPSNIAGSKYRHLDVGSFEDQRDAAFVSQMFRLSENSYEMIINFIINKYEKNMDNDSNRELIFNEFGIEIPKWEYASLRGLDYAEDSSEIISFSINERKAAKERMESLKLKAKEEKEKKENLKNNYKVYLDKWLKFGFTKETFNADSVKLIISGKIK